MEKIMLQKNKRSFGSVGENLAEGYLIKNGFRIIKKNYRVGRIGEIDLIAREKEFLCFIEVKTRKSIEFGTPAEAVTFRKRETIKKLAYIYINNNRLYDCHVRFDIVEIVFDNSNSYNINLIMNAF
jgi:putative endonuclease